MGGMHGNLKTIVKGSGCYHEMRWNVESLYPQTEEKETWLTHEQAVRIGLTPGSRLYRQATGELLSEE
jgi:hypothetical protein